MAYANALRRCDTCWGYETSGCVGCGRRRCPRCSPGPCCSRDLSRKSGKTWTETKKVAK